MTIPTEKMHIEKLINQFLTHHIFWLNKEKDNSYLEFYGIYKNYEYYGVGIYLGHRCGYVIVPNDKLINEGSIQCHGGITFKESYENYDILGFDCMHSHDKYDTKIIEKFGTKGKLRDGCSFGAATIKSKNYVENECKNIIDQLIIE